MQLENQEGFLFSSWQYRQHITSPFSLSGPCPPTPPNIAFFPPVLMMIRRIFYFPRTHFKHAEPLSLAQHSDCPSWLSLSLSLQWEELTVAYYHVEINMQLLTPVTLLSSCFSFSCPLLLTTNTKWLITHIIPDAHLIKGDTKSIGCSWTFVLVLVEKLRNHKLSFTWFEIYTHSGE